MKSKWIVPLMLAALLASAVPASTEDFSQPDDGLDVAEEVLYEEGFSLSEMASDEPELFELSDSDSEELAETDFSVEEVVEEAAASSAAHIYYSTQIQNRGWISEVRDGAQSGTTGEAKRLEAIKIHVDSALDGSVQYRTHIQNRGWEKEWKSDGEISGTEGLSLRLEAIEIRLTGELADYYDVYYSVHAQNFGWTGYACNGNPCGTSGYAYRLEAIDIQLVEKGMDGPASSAIAFYENTSTIAYQTHVQNVGWQGYVRDGAVAGTSGKSYRLEAIRIELRDKAFEGGVEYRTHVQNKGWMDWVCDNALSGTSGESKRLEAIQIRLTGTMAKKYDVYYCVHAQNIGWMGWAKNGQMAGTEGYSYRLEAIRVKLVPKSNPAPGKTTDYFRKYVKPTATPTPTPKPRVTATPTPKPVVRTYYWTPSGSKYHSTKDCPSLARSKTIYSGTTPPSGRDKCKNCF